VGITNIEQKISCKSSFRPCLGTPQNRVIGFTGYTHGAGMPWSPITEILRLKLEYVRSLHGLHGEKY
jgi:hypothetical protein